jgi:uracil-DNA glycosylase
MHGATGKDASAFVPPIHTLPVLRHAVQDCRECDLYKDATQAVLGETQGDPDGVRARVAMMMIGEQPGDREDPERRRWCGSAQHKEGNHGAI